METGYIHVFSHADRYTNILPDRCTVKSPACIHVLYQIGIQLNYQCPDMYMYLATVVMPVYKHLINQIGIYKWRLGTYMYLVMQIGKEIFCQIGIQ